jgi:serine/threonine protein phosphatase PrpC
MKMRPGNAQHQGARDTQQDSFAFSDLDDRAFVSHGGVLALVADGMGGLAHGGAAGMLAVRAFLERYQAKRSDEPIPRALDAALDCANLAVVDLARTAGELGNVGATLAAAVVHEGRLYWVSVGDSRVYLYRGGRIAQVTHDHVYAADLDAQVAAGQLTAAAAQADHEREALTSHLGKPSLPRVDRSERALPLVEGDRVLLCTDGLYRALAVDEMAAPLAGGAQRACETLVARTLAKELPQQDNVTVLALALGGAGTSASTEHTDARTGRFSLGRRPLRIVLLAAFLLAAALFIWRYIGWVCCAPPIEPPREQRSMAAPAPHAPLREPRS